MHKVEDGQPELLPRWSWVRLVVEGETFQTGPAEWDREIAAVYAVPDRVRWVSADHRVSADFAVHEGRVVCLGVTHRGALDAPVSSSAIRDVRLEEAGRWALLQHASEEVMGRAPTSEESAAGNESAAFFHTEHRPLGDDLRSAVGKVLDQQVRGTRGRPPIPRAELERAARIYNTSESRPVQAVAELLNLSQTQATRRVQMARQAGLIPPARPKRKPRG